MKQIGIYKVTSPNGRIYIGQSIDIQRRFYRYKRLCVSTKRQPLLYRSLKKYGPENHLYDIITECSPDELNEYERYYQDLYNACEASSGMNCRLTSASDRSPFFQKKQGVNLEKKPLEENIMTIPAIKCVNLRKEEHLKKEGNTNLNL